MTTEPTLEQIAAMPTERSPLLTPIVARELLALRKSTQVSREIDLHALSTVAGQVAALESQDRGYQEDGALAVESGDPCLTVLERIAFTQGIERLQRRNNRLDLELGEVRTKLEAELADARRERDEVTREYRDQVARDRERYDVLARQLAELAAVQPWVQHHAACAYGVYGMQVQSIPGEAHARRCTCGLSAALASTSKEDAS